MKHKILMLSRLKENSADMIEKIPKMTPTLAHQILTVQIASYRVEANLLNYPNLPPLHETVDDILETSEEFLVYHDGDQIVGAVSYEISKETLEIGRLVVHPNHFRRGIARRLLEAVEEIDPNIRRLIVSTGAANIPAITLYQKMGYQLYDRLQLPDGLKLVRLEKFHRPKSASSKN